MNNVEFAVIGGTGVYDPNMLKDIEVIEVETTYGVVPVTVGLLGKRKVAFLARHGAGHKVPPHLVNYRANLMALSKLGVKKVIATAAVGSLNKEMAPGKLVLCDQFLDFTKTRVQTFYDGGEAGVLHVDVTDPYCSDLRKNILDHAPEGLVIINGGTYVCTEGPRYETPAEIKMFEILGGDLVGMTSVPEVMLAKELNMCYATICMVTNFAAGISPTPLTHSEVTEVMNENIKNLQTVITNTIEAIPPEQHCNCPLANQEAGSLS